MIKDKAHQRRNQHIQGTEAQGMSCIIALAASLNAMAMAAASG